MSEQDSESEPFQSSGSEYLPTETDEPGTHRGIRKRKTKLRVRKQPQKVENIRKGRKRPRREHEWARNIRKVSRASGDEYVNTVKKVVPKRVVGSDCVCPRRCFLNISQQIRQSVLEAFNKLADKEKQDLYLAGLISSKPIARKRQRTGEGTQKSVSHTYKIRVGSEEYQVCRKAFMAIHGITKYRVDRLASRLTKNITPSADMRGKHGSRPNKIPCQIKMQIDNHIKSFPRRSSHYSREKNDGKYYLPSDLNISKMHMMYLKKYEAAVYQRLVSGDQCQPKVTYDFYYRHFTSNYNISFGVPRSDTCQTCDRLVNLIAGEANNENKVALQTEKTVHLHKAEVFYKNLKQKSALAKENPNVETLCFDYQQNLPLPHIPAGDVFYKRQLWEYNFCIFSAKTGISSFYMYDEATGKKGSNEVISFFQHYIQTYLPPEVTELYIFSDNAFAQNKNQTLVKYLYTLTNMESNNITQVVHQYPEPGHSFLPCDRSFGLIEKNKRKKERIYTAEEWRNLVRETSKNFKVINVNQKMIHNHTEHFKALFKGFRGTNKEKFAISTYRVFKYIKNNGVIQCSASAGLTIYSTFTLIKTDPQSQLSMPTEKCYKNILLINDKKVKDCKSLVQKYVPAAYQDFYKTIFGDLPTDQPEEDSPETSEENEGYETDSSLI